MEKDLVQVNNSLEAILDVSNYKLDITNFSSEIHESAITDIVNQLKESTNTGSNLFNAFNKKAEIFYEAIIDDKAKLKLNSGEWNLKCRADGKGILPFFFKGNERIDKQVALKKVKRTSDSAQALSNIAIQQSLKEINEKIDHVVSIVTRVEQGQRNDRISLVLSARQMFLEALSLKDKEMKKFALHNAISLANNARLKLMLTLKTDCDELKDESEKNSLLHNNKKTIDHLIQNIEQSYKAIGFATQLIASVYNLLNENESMIVSLKLYEQFLQNTLLEKKENDQNVSEILHMNCSYDSVKNFWLDFPNDTKSKVEQIIEQKILFENKILLIDDNKGLYNE
jgi:hypothetical protein